jgi:hypothetical protein
MKLKILQSVALGGVLFLFFSCEKIINPSAPVTASKQVNAVAERIYSSNKKGADVSYAFRSTMGHSSSSCNGKCGSKGHVNCQGAGNVCNLYAPANVFTANAVMATKANDAFQKYYAITWYPEDLSDEEIFLMPARSFFVEEEAIYINIPEQILNRDAKTQCFIIENITFTNEQIFINK